MTHAPSPLDLLLSLDAPRRPAPDEAARLLVYVQRLVDHPRPNLTAARSVEDAVRVLVVPSLAVAEAWPPMRPAPRLVVDIGSGNGFPGLAAAALWPTARVHLVERRQRKAAALAEHVAAGGFADRVTVHAADARELLTEVHGLVAAADLVLVRAVGPMGDTTRLAAPFVAPGGRLVHWKGPGLGREELAEGRRVAAGLGLVEGPTQSGEGERTLRVFERPRGERAPRRS